LGSGSGLGDTFSVLAGGVLSLGGVVVLLGDADGTVDVEGSLGDLAVLLLVGSLGGGLGNLSLVGDGVLVWDDNVLGTDVGVGSSGLGGEFGVGSGSLGGAQSGVLSTEGVSSASVAGGASASWGAFAHVSILARGAVEGDGGGKSEEGCNNEFHLEEVIKFIKAWNPY
jgi:hypothetical protein